MSNEILGERRKALEETFFANENAKLLEKLRIKKSAEAAKEALVKISGIASDDVLDKLAALGIDAETWAAISIAPMVAVAWADGKIDVTERRAVLSAAEENGISVDSSSYSLLQNWLARRPADSLMEVWETFIAGLCAELDPVVRDALRSEVLGRAREVAEATGGFLGLGSKISAVEEAVLLRLEKAFHD